MRLELSPMSDEKDELLWKYMKQWRTVYGYSARNANTVERYSKRNARNYYRAHQFDCDHDESCQTVLDYLRQIRDGARNVARLKIKDKLRKQYEQDAINYLAFSQAWFKGFANRKSLPDPYRLYALIPRKVVRFSHDQQFIILTLAPHTELWFARDTFPELPDDDTAIRLYCRDPNRTRNPQRTWLLEIGS